MSESPNEFVAEVPGIGQFTFAKRTMRLEIRASVELRRLTEGVVMDDFTLTFLRAMADLKALILQAPDGFNPSDLDDMDPDDDDTYGRILKVWGALREQEATFRRAREASKGSGASPSGDV